MQFVWGPIPVGAAAAASGPGWVPLASPSAERATVQALVGMLPLIAGAGLALRPAAEGLPAWAFLLVLAAPGPLILAHELAHALGYLVDVRSPLLLTGIWPARGTWYVVYDAPMRRGRVLLMLVAPFLAFTLLPALALPLVPRPVAWGLLYVVLMHAALCVGDLRSFGRIARQVPRKAWVYNRGWSTYWSTNLADPGG